MSNYISEEQIEKAILDIFQINMQYRHINCFNKDPEDLNDGRLF